MSTKIIWRIICYTNSVIIFVITNEFSNLFYTTKLMLKNKICLKQCFLYDHRRDLHGNIYTYFDEHVVYFYPVVFIEALEIDKMSNHLLDIMTFSTFCTRDFRQCLIFKNTTENSTHKVPLSLHSDRINYDKKRTTGWI